MPSILVIDPLTGQKMRSWEGMISAERLLEVIHPATFGVILQIT
jgi:hypothetical protein